MASFSATVDATLGRIRAEQARLDWRKALFGLAFLPLFVAGWVVRKAALVVWLVVSFGWSAAKVGWVAATPPEDSG